MMDTQDLSADFNGALARLKSGWRRGLLLREGVRLAGTLVVALAVYALADYFLALQDGARIGLNIVLMSVFVLFATLRTVPIFLLADKDAARYADVLLHSPRYAILSGYELSAWKPDAGQKSSKLLRFLIQRSINEAATALRGLEFRDYYPFQEIRRELKLASLKLMAACALLLLNPTAGAMALGRIVLPWRDIPPYSRYTFKLSPSKPTVLYGGNVELAVDITGAPVKSPVVFMSRYQGNIHNAACFQENSQRFAQRLEKIVSPVEVCFALGKARSRWHRVQILYQPIIAMASVTIMPPGYTRLPKRQFFAGAERLAGVRGSRVELTVTSNRPLLDGRLTMHPKNTAGRDDAIILETRSGLNTVTFAWMIRETAELAVTVRDLQGTKNNEPYKLDQTMLSDDPPEAVITEPANFALATPETSLDLQGYAADDFSLSRVSLLQAVTGYRDRVRLLGPPEAERRFDFSVPIDLQAIGAEVGQILEFYIEALDENPLLTGAAASEIVRLKIISEDEYAAILRARTTLDAFLNRYRQTSDRLMELKSALREFKKAAESGQKSAAELESQRERAARLHRETAELFEKTAADFPIFDAEEGLAAVLKDLVQPLRENERTLLQMQVSHPGLAKALGDMLLSLGARETPLNREIKRSEEIARIARLMECAAAFKAIIVRQETQVRRLSRFVTSAAGKDLPLLSALGRYQEEIRVALGDFQNNLKKYAAQVPDEYGELKESAREFNARIDRLRIDELMKSAVNASENQDGRQTGRYARLALERLQLLLKECSGSAFGGMCQCGLKFEVPADLQATLMQMLAALMMPNSGAGAPGAGAAGGGLFGGDINDGYWMGGTSPLNIPVFGPARAMPTMQASAGAGSAAKSSRGNAAAVSKTELDAMSVLEKAPVTGKSMPLENVPEKYRAAVKRYFSQEDSLP